MKYKLNITEKNILEGERANPENCAIARSIKGKIRNKITNLSVLPSHVVLSFNKKNYIAEMPKEGAEFIKRFDRGLPVNSFKLNLKFKKGFALV
jgi:hypothetical protein